MAHARMMVATAHIRAPSALVLGLLDEVEGIPNALSCTCMHIAYLPSSSIDVHVFVLVFTMIGMTGVIFSILVSFESESRALPCTVHDSD